VAHYPGHLAFLEEAASQLGVAERSVVDQARRLPPLSHLSSLVGQAYEAHRHPLHREVDLTVAARQVAVLETAVTAAKAILLKAQADLAPAPMPSKPEPNRPRGTRKD
jgi:hypothetical protein